MVEPGDIAVVHYVGRFASGAESGEVFDTSDVDVALSEGVYQGHRDYRPLSFEVGADEIIPGIDAAVRTMDVGDERTVTVDPDEAYGDRSADSVVEVPRGELETRSGRDARPGRPVQSANGEIGWIIDVTEETVTVDFNHELAGERLEFELRLLEVREPAEDQQSTAT
ncbi:FKBP-type peptidyl-prolyl cis-trans isomerase [Haloarchaeobius litoreus]|uniref:Peptidyl-prolyl cis-trans isomerase n=1 Tax=Haloarchaeobius litoreus TaxID=755306 RepID=A0ABD6DN31_9EURY|nr:FKBP-type peptidyl-prolyl cis-trans isomerase [Haloarchaeobius litoreus]